MRKIRFQSHRETITVTKDDIEKYSIFVAIKFASFLNNELSEVLQDVLSPLFSMIYNC